MVVLIRIHHSCREGDLPWVLAYPLLAMFIYTTVLVKNVYNNQFN